MGSKSTPVPKPAAGVRREVRTEADCGGCDLLPAEQALSRSMAAPTSKRSRGFGPVPRGIAPSSSACA
jgi:hypothetical protein